MTKFSRADTTKGVGMAFTTFAMNVIPNYPCDWWCIYSIWIWYTYLNMFFAPTPVFIMNARRPQTYLLARLRKWSIMSLVFETEISNLSDSLSIYFVALRQSLIPFVFWTCLFMFILLKWFMSHCACLLVNTIKMYRIWCVIFLFTINIVDEKMIVSFFHACKRER